MINDFIDRFDSGHVFSDGELRNIIGWIYLYIDDDTSSCSIDNTIENTNIIRIADRYFCIYEYKDTFSQPFEIVKTENDYYPLDKVRNLV